jgi:hypothetical protein
VCAGGTAARNVACPQGEARQGRVIPPSPPPYPCCRGAKAFQCSRNGHRAGAWPCDCGLWGFASGVGELCAGTAPAFCGAGSQAKARRCHA